MHFLFLLWLFLPAFVANAAPVLVRNVPVLREWKHPISPRLLGQNKTWRGFVSGVVLGAVTGLLQGAWSTWVLREPESILQFTLWGLLLGLGALLGDAVKSFAKRRLGIAPGQAWPVFDGVDYMIGALTLTAFVVPLPLEDWIFLIVVGPIASSLANMTAYLLGWKDVWY